MTLEQSVVVVLDPRMQIADRVLLIHRSRGRHLGLVLVAHLGRRSRGRLLLADSSLLMRELLVPDEKSC